MKKLLKVICAVMLAVMMIGMCACSSSSSKSSSHMSEREQVEWAVNVHLHGYLYARFPDPNARITYNISDNGGYYGVTGSITLTDAAGYRCSGTYSCTVTYNESSDEYKVSNVNISDFYRNLK